jgi:hypothetical protein
MKRLAIVLVTLALPRVASAQDCDKQSNRVDTTEGKPAPFDSPHMVRLLVGLGYVPSLPMDDRSSNLLPDDTMITTEIGGHPLSGALGTGVSISVTTDIRGYWTVLTPGLFAKLDLTYLLLSGLWRYTPPDDFPIRLQAGGRLGLGVSQSTRPKSDVPNAEQYVLIRPELLDFLDLEIPLGGDRIYSFVLRGAMDTPINLSGVYRWGISAGLSYGWGQ